MRKSLVPATCRRGTLRQVIGIAGRGAEAGGWLTHSQIESLTGFLGYGNPAGAFWFIGLEERASGTDDVLRHELEVRAQHFGPIEDLTALEAKEFDTPTFSIANYVRTWRIMSKIVLHLRGNDDWQLKAADYQAKRLGRRDGETFLAELLPLPAPSASQWPYTRLFPTRAAYESSILPRRIEALRTLLRQHRPAWIFCYGKSYWSQFQRLFPDIAEFRPLAGGDILTGLTPARGRAVLTPFFTPYRMSDARIAELAQQLGLGR